MKKITICSSADFYRQAVDLQDKLERAGFAVLLPDTAEKMKQTGDFDVSHYKTWFDNDADYHKKAKLMRDHFDKVAAGDVVLVLNFEKRGAANYIGGNVLMEMSLAFYLKKPIVIYNDIPSDSPFLEEILGMSPIAVQGNVDTLLKTLT